MNKELLNDLITTFERILILLEDNQHLPDIEGFYIFEKQIIKIRSLLKELKK